MVILSVQATPNGPGRARDSESQNPPRSESDTPPEIIRLSAAEIGRVIHAFLFGYLSRFDHVQQALVE
jgi:hypothetical protein